MSGYSPYIALAETVQDSVLGPDHDPSVGDGWRGEQRRGRIKLPELFAGFKVEHIEASVTGANIDAPIGSDWRRVDPCAGHERPCFLSGLIVYCVHHSVPPAYDHLAIDVESRRIEGEVPRMMFVAPENLLLRQVNAEHFVVVRAEERKVSVNRWGCCGVPSRQTQDFHSIGYPNTVKHLVAATKVSDPVGHRGRCVNVVRCFVSPHELTVGDCQAVEVAVIGPDQDVISDDDRRRT